MNTELKTILDRVERLELLNNAMTNENAQMKSENVQMKAQFRSDRRRLRAQLGLALLSIIGAILVSPGSRSAIAQGYGTTLAQLAVRMTAVEQKTQYVSVDSSTKTMLITGANLQIVNGLGATNGFPTNPSSIDPTLTNTNGLGNLIIGYNEANNIGFKEVRNGSHNLVVGKGNSYISYGCGVLGTNNRVNGPYSSVTGGGGNIANGFDSSISGGAANRTPGDYSSVSGGNDNHAVLEASSVSGGFRNTASGNLSSVSGGYNRSATGDFNWVAGGLFQSF